MNKYFIRYTGEIGTKDKRTRWNFIKKLADNIHKALNSISPDEKSEVIAGWDHIQISTPDTIDAVLLRIPGISSFSLVKALTLESTELLIKEAYSFFKNDIKGKKFAVRCKRRGKHDFSSKDIECLLGDKLISKGKVDLSHPDIVCYVDIKDNKVFFYTSKNKGLGGMPLGAQGKALTLFSGGIDSPVAAWRAYRSGMDQDFVYFHLGGEEQKQIIVNTYKYLKENWGYGSKSKLIIIDFMPIIKEILDNAKSYYHNLVLKYFFYQAAEKLAQELQASALVTGESIGQVSTQTLKNLAALDQTISTLIVRPLSTLTKEEIIQQAKRIGTFDMSYKGREYCALAIKNVATSASFDNLMKAVASLNVELLEQVINERQIVTLEDIQEVSVSKQVDIPKGSEIIDLRTQEEFKQGALENAINIPFQEAWADYIHWEKSKHYFLICNVGSQSKILSEYMKKDGYKVAHLEGGIKHYQKAGQLKKVTA